MEYNQAFKYAVAWNRTSLRFVGLWPEPNDGVFTKLKGWFGAWLIFMTIYLPQSTLAYVNWGDMNAVIESLSINGPILIAIIKIIIFRHYRDVLKLAIVTMTKDWSELRSKEEYKVMLKTAKISRIISVTSTIITNTLFIAFVFFKIWIGMQLMKRTDLDPRLSVGLLYPGYLPFDSRIMMYFIPTWTAQCFATCFSMTAYAAFDTFVSCMVLHICGQLAVVGISLKNLINDDVKVDSKVFWNKFSEIIKHHEEINKLGLMIENSFNSILLPQMFVCTVTFCLQGFAMITSFIDPSAGKISILEMLFSIVYVFYTVMHLFVYCYVGDYLSFESTLIGQSYYKSNWYELPVNKSRSLMFIGHRARRPLLLTAGKFCAFSRNLFLAVLKTSFGYLSMLLAVKQEKISDS
ncbi:odorant receptor 13a-like [Microplitis mediator]|uniref:odorant receptor 13a-like n=1 Tax=Microplitis mediator TaxID=375433 RepID=UPI002555CCD6|nr:odorant receptor 13a-like [Microplitis mediator]